MSDTPRVVTDRQIRALREEAEAAQDVAMAMICTIALGELTIGELGEVIERACAKAIAAALAVAEEDRAVAADVDVLLSTVHTRSARAAAREVTARARASIDRRSSVRVYTRAELTRCSRLELEIAREQIGLGLARVEGEDR